jgi:hypothetical protein
MPRGFMQWHGTNLATLLTAFGTSDRAVSTYEHAILKVA